MGKNELENFKLIENCLACDSTELTLVLDLKSQALANSFQNDLQPTQLFPLALNYCHECSHLQLSHSVNPEVLFTDYLYVSGTTNTLHEYFRNFAKKIDQEWGTALGDKTVLDVACNDGTQLDYFKSLGWKTMGIDPARNLVAASSRNHFVICDFLSEKHSGFIQSKVLIAQNVLAHTPNPLQFLQIASEISDVILIQTSQAFMVERNQFDTVYHEHMSFFSEASMQRLAARAGLEVMKVEIMPIHGDSFLFTLQKKKKLSTERNHDFLSFDRVTSFAQNATQILFELSATINSAKERGRAVIGYGAAAKGMTVLNALDAEIDFLVDDSPLKVGKYSPGRGYHLKNIESLREIGQPISIVLLAWNFESEIRLRIANLGIEDIEFITYFPTVKVST